MHSPSRVFTRTEILEHVWGYDFNHNTNLVDVCVQRFRNKIEKVAGDSWIDTVRGVGYSFRQSEKIGYL
jgi:DNA-binding response OmpR family regulator